MTTKRGITMFHISLIILVGISKTHGDYMMGGHLDNNEEHDMPVMEHRSADETIGTSLISSRTSNLEDIEHDFDLEFDLLAEQSAVHPTRTSVVTSSSSNSGGISSSDDESSITEETETAPRYRVLPYAFNGGHPFSLEKDPITGQIDFEKAPPLKALEYSVETSVQTDETSDKTNDEISNIDSTSNNDDNNPIGPNEINPYSPSFHDFLNLPIRYTNKNSEKYPLISNSYANTKVQSGSNSYNTYNHKKYHEVVKTSSVDMQNNYVQPSRKTYIQSLTRPTTISPTSTPTTQLKITTTTMRTTTTSKKPKITTSTTTTTSIPITTTVKPSYNGNPAVTTWKPQEKPDDTNNYGMYDDYEAILPIERLQTGISMKQTTTTTTTTEKSRYVPAPPRPKPSNVKPSNENDRNKEYDDVYEEDYDHILQIATRPPSTPVKSQEDQHDDSQQDDYTYGIMDFVEESRPSGVKKTETNIVTSTMPSTMKTSTRRVFPIKTDEITSTRAPTTMISTSIVTKENENNNPDRMTTTTTTTVRPSMMEEKRVTSMPIDTIVNNDNYRVTSTNYPNNLHVIGNIDNSIPSVTSNNILYQNNRPATNDNYYSRPSIVMPSAGIVVKSTSNVVVPPGQDTVSFVLGNRQSVGSVSDAGNEFYGIQSPSTSNDRTTISFGKIANSRPIGGGTIDNYSGQMIVSAGIGVGSAPIGYHHHHHQQRPTTSVNNFDHAVVTVGMPTVDVVNPSESGTTVNNVNKNPDSSTNSLDTMAQKWWSSTSSSANQQTNSQVSQESTNQQFGYRVVFPDEKGHVAGFNGPARNENTSETPRPIEEHVIVVHESDIGSGLHLDLSSQTSTLPTTDYHYETTTTTNQRFPGTDDKLLPELSESLTPPAERPNILPSGIQRPTSYNYYHHHHHTSGNSRPNDYQRLPQRLPLPSTSATSSNNFKRRQPLSSTIESNLPNILPQFRPNAKTSHGHNRGETIGTIPAGSVPPYVNTRIRRPLTTHHHNNHHQQRPATLRRPINVSPSHLQRLNPPPRPPPPPPITSLRLPTPASLVASTNLIGSQTQHDSSLQNTDNRLGGQNRLHKVTIGVPPSIAIDERHHQSSSSFASTQPIKSRLEDNIDGDLERFSAEPPSRPPYFTKRTTNGEQQLPDGMPRIATLQMIQQHAVTRDEDDVIRPNLPPPYRFNGEKNSSNSQNDNDDEESVEGNEENASRSPVNRRGDNDEKSNVSQDTPGDYVDTVDSPVYVVYPVKGALDIHSTSNDDTEQDDASVVLGTYGPQRPLPPDTLLQDTNDNESTNLAVNNDNNSYRPTSILNVSPSFVDSSSGPQLASDFPYPLERPDPSLFTSQLREKPLLVPSEQQQKNGRRPETDKDKITDDDVINERDIVIRDIDRDSSVNVIPYLQDHVPFTLKENAGVISATLHRLGPSSSIHDSSSTPIAYVYTPTARTPVRRNEDYSYVQQSSLERGNPVLLPSQQPSSSSSSAPSPQSFMAPFVASASAEAPTKNGWSVVMIGQPGEDSTSMERRQDEIKRQNENLDKRTSNVDVNVTREDQAADSSDENNKRIVEEKKKITDETERNNEEMKNNEETEKPDFDVESFTPQLFGGFKPIFEFPSDNERDTSMSDKVNGDTGVMVERPRSETV